MFRQIIPRLLATIHFTPIGLRNQAVRVKIYTFDVIITISSLSLSIFSIYSMIENILKALLRHIEYKILTYSIYILKEIT